LARFVTEYKTIEGISLVLSFFAFLHDPEYEWHYHFVPSTATRKHAREPFYLDDDLRERIIV